jgi:hypothetical protein
MPVEEAGAGPREEGVVVIDDHRRGVVGGGAVSGEGGVAGRHR